ncbi:hypothetical protein G9P44_004311 [Scheffersomyces stipitis]|nr:hypothetical protein G9P44_004311 [Scheffersomyces stipitis]
MSSIESNVSNNKAESLSNDDSVPYKTVTYSGEGNEYVIIDGKKYLRHELMTAFGGTFNPGLAPYPKHQFGNAAALGLASFAVTTMVLGLFYSGAMGISTPNVVVSMCVFYGGAVELLAGVWEMAIGNTFAGTVFVSFGAFWISFGVIFIEAFGIASAYADDPAQFGNAVGIYLIGWAIFTFMMLTLVLKATWPFIALFVTLETAFILLAAGNMTGNAHVVKAGGIFACITASCGFWIMYAGVSVPTNSYLHLPVMQVPIIGSKR